MTKNLFQKQENESVKSAILEKIAENLSHNYFIYHVNTRHFIYINPVFENLWGINQEVIQQHPASLWASIHPEDKGYLLQHYQRLLIDLKEVKIEFRIVLPDQNTRWIHLAAYAFNSPEQAGVSIGGFAEDITQQKTYIADILKFNAKKNSILQILSHDLAAPFHNIEGLIKVLENQIQAGDMNLEPIIDFIKQDAKKGSDLIRDFIDNEFLESSQIALHKTRTDIVSKFAVMVEDYKNRKLLVSREIKFIAPALPVYVNLDEMKFMQVMNNLIGNAIKFTPDHGLISISITEKISSILITVTDDGIGIPEALQPILFDKFTKARRPGIRGEKSVGLGMSIILTIVQLHQGHVWLKSKENEGSTFYIEIPKI